MSEHVITRSEILAVDALCAATAVRDGIEEPCCKPATTILYDPEAVEVWPACSWHANRYGSALTLAQIRTALTEGSVWIEREEPAMTETCFDCGTPATLCEHDRCPGCCDRHWEPDPDLEHKTRLEDRTR